MTVLCFRLLVPNAKALGGGAVPGPSAVDFAGPHSVVLSHGIKSMEPVKVWSMAIGALVGIALPLLALVLSEAPEVGPVGGRPRPGVDLPLVL